MFQTYGEQKQEGTAMPGNHTIFISYRREDAAGWAGRLHADLRSRLGPGTKVFMDVDGIPAGADYASYIDSVVGQSDTLIAMIGPAWASPTQEGQRRIDDPGDFVRLEIESALGRRIRVIPMLVGGVPLPAAGALPQTLRPLVNREALQMDNATWLPGLDRLITSITNDDDGPPKLTLSTVRLDFGAVATNEQWPRKTVQFRNEGGGELNAVAHTRESWIVLRTRNDAIDVLVDPSNPGEYTGRINVSSAGGSATIAVTASVQVERRAPAPPPAPEVTRNPAQVGAWSSPVPTVAQPVNPGGYRYFEPIVRSIPTHLAMAIFATVAFWPTGIPSIVYAVRVSNLIGIGDAAGAVTASKKSKMWSIVSFVLFALFLIIIVAASANKSTPRGY